MPPRPRCPRLPLAVPLAAVHALCSGKGCKKKARKVCQSERGAGAEAARCWCADGGCRSGGPRPLELRLPLSHGSTAMNGATSTLCVRACVRGRGPLGARKVQHQQPSKCCTAKKKNKYILESDKRRIIISGFMRTTFLQPQLLKVCSSIQFVIFFFLVFSIFLVNCI